MTLRTRCSAAILATGMLVLLGAPAHAGVTDPPSDVIDQATDVVTGTVDGATAAAGDVVDDVTAAAGDATGGASDPVTDPVQDAVDKAEDVTGEAEDTAGEVVSGAEDAVDGAVGAVDEATGGVIDDATGGEDGDGPDGRQTRPQARPVSTAARLHGRTPAGGSHSARPPRARRHAATAPPAARNPAPTTGVAYAGGAPAPSLGERLGQAAIDATRQLALPLGLTLIVLAFVLAQHWADRKDPKLAFAPVDSDHDLLGFQ